ncbi:MAG: hypothetical protein AAGH15_15670, partial [Myxococcota bacterium]
DVGAADAAYQQVDFEGMQAAAAAVASGACTRDELARAYRLLGISLSALGQEREAYDAFVKLLVLDPEVSLDVSPTLRGPFMEARGAMGSRRLDAEVTLNPLRGALVVTISDPFEMVARLGGEATAGADGATVPFDEASAREVVIDVPGLADAGFGFYFLRLVDEAGNVLLERGTQNAPLEIGERRSSPGAGEVIVVERSGGVQVKNVLAGIGAGLGVAAIAGGAVLHLSGNDDADTYNSDLCLTPVTPGPAQPTRDSICGPGGTRGNFRDDAETKQRNAVILYALGGALLATGVVLFVVGGDDEEQGDATAFEMSCRSAGLGMSCSGHF